MRPPSSMLSSLHFLARRHPLHALALAAAVLCAGCANYTGIQATQQPIDATQLGLPGRATPAVAAQWWSAFGDTQLDALVAQALAQHPSLQVAQARLARAQAAIGIAEAASAPQVGVGLDLTEQLFSAKSIYPPPLGGTVRDMGTLQASGSWEVDFFGKHRAALDSALGQVRAAQADAQASANLLASNVVRAYFQLARIDAQLALAERTLAQREQQHRLVHDRVQAGLDTALELRQSEGAIPEARLQSEALHEQRALTQNALAALLAKPNTQVAPVKIDLFAIKSLATPDTLGVDLLARRADVAAAKARVQAAVGEVDAAKAQFWPNINLAAFVGVSSIGFDRLLTTGAEQWGVGPALRLPLFDGGRLRANLRGKTAELDAAVASYNSAVIDAVRDAADPLSSLQALQRQRAEQAQAQASAQAAYDIALQRYQAGLGTYLHVLAAESAVLAQRRAGVDLVARTLDTQAQLMRALGGGFEDSTAPLALR